MRGQLKKTTEQLTALLFALVVGCATHDDAPVEKIVPGHATAAKLEYPGWMLRPPVEDGMVYGLGSDSEFTRAHVKSLVDISFQLNAQVKSVLDEKSAAEEDTRESVVVALDEQVSKTAIRGAKVVEEHRPAGDDVWVLSRMPLDCVLDLTESVLMSYAMELRMEKEAIGELVEEVEKRLAVERVNTALETIARPQPVSEGYIFIEGGTFTIGSPTSESGRGDNERQHQVTVGSFYMKTTEVTVGEFRTFVQDTGYKTQTEREGDASVWTGNERGENLNANWQNPGFNQTDNNPVTCVSWYDAVEYFNWLSVNEGLTPVYHISDKSVTANFEASGYRLPTEAEWEYAARGGTTTAFHYGNSLSSTQANFNGNYPYGGASTGVYSEATTKAGSFSPNAYGLYDMHGNVNEWCWDWYDDYPRKSQSDPRGPSSGSYRVVRGGSWYYYGHDLRSANRDYRTPSYQYYNLGFRPVRRG